MKIWRFTDCLGRDLQIKEIMGKYGLLYEWNNVFIISVRLKSFILIFQNELA